MSAHPLDRALDSAPHQRFARSLRWLIDAIERGLRPSLPEKDPLQIRAIAADVAIQLGREYGGTYLRVPANAELLLRNAALVEQHDGTVNGPNGINALCKRYRLSENSVRRILEDHRQSARQARLRDTTTQDSSTC